MEKNKGIDRMKIGAILKQHKDGNYTYAKSIDDIFALFEVKQPFTSKDFDKFMYREVREKGESFKNEICLIEGCSMDEGVLITIPVDTDSYKTCKEFDQIWKSFDTMLRDWEFVTGEPFGK